jgi:arabinose-5-phosphate isomerase
MLSSQKIIESAKKTIALEQSAIANLSNFINDEFAACVSYIFNNKGRVVVTGIGKSAIIANKIVATLNSTGTPAIFMHAADAIHGDLGTIQKDDVVICISKSGNTPEIKVLVPLLKNFGNKLVALVGNIDSYLAKQADFVLNCTVSQEACPNNLAPTSSTTAQLVMGDALSICLLECRGFTSEDFARYHPGGSLGKRLYLKVADLIVNNEVPKVSMNAGVREIIMEISSKRLGATAVLDNEKLAGIITDGDLRRMIEKTTDLTTITAKEIMTANPKSIDRDELAVNALQLFQKHNITQLIVTHQGIYFGILHFHDLLREGII